MVKFYLSIFTHIHIYDKVSVHIVESNKVCLMLIFFRNVSYIYDGQCFNPTEHFQAWLRLTIYSYCMFFFSIISNGGKRKIKR